MIHLGRAAFLFGVASYSGISFHLLGIGWASLGGLFITITLALYFYALSREDASRIAPIIATTPVFTFGIASVLFGEWPTALEVTSLLVVVAGIVAINLQPARGTIGFTKMKPFLAALTSSFAAASAFIAMDKATQHIDPVSADAFRTLCVGLFVGLFVWRKALIRSARTALSDRETLVLFLITEGVIAVGFMALFTYAVSVGPVGPVSTIVTAITPVAVFVAATILSKSGSGFLAEKTDRGTLALKLIGTTLVVAGIVALRAG